MHRYEHISVPVGAAFSRERENAINTFILGRGCGMAVHTPSEKGVVIQAHLNAVKKVCV